MNQIYRFFFFNLECSKFSQIFSSVFKLKPLQLSFCVDFGDENIAMKLILVFTH